MMKCNYVRRSESNQTAEQTEENFAARKGRERVRIGTDFWFESRWWARWKAWLFDCLL